MSEAAVAAAPKGGNVAVAGMAAGYVVAIVAPLPAERTVPAVAAVVGLVAMLVRAKAFYRWAALVLVALGAVIVATTRARLAGAWLGFADLLDITTLLLAIPTLAVPFGLRAYGDDVGTLVARRVHRAGARYAVLSAVSGALAAMISIGAAPLVHSSIRFHRDNPPLEARGLTRGVVLGVMWSPMGGFFTTVLTRVAAPPAALMGVCFGTAAVAWCVDAATARRAAANRSPTPPESSREGTRAALSGALTLVAAVVVYSGLLIVLHELTGVSIIDAVILVAVPYVLIWALLLGELPRAARRVRAIVWRETSAVCSQGSVLLAMGFLGAAFVDAGFGEALARWLTGIGAPGVLAVVLLSLVPILLAPLGLHPFIVVVLLLGFVDADTLGVPVLALGVAMMGAAAGSLALSQFSAVVNVTATLTRLTPARVAWLNARFGVLTWLLGCLGAAGIVLLT